MVVADALVPNRHQAPVPLTRGLPILIEFRIWSKYRIFRLNSKFDQNWKCFGIKCAQPITAEFCTRHVCKISSWSAAHVLNKSTSKCHRTSNSVEKSLLERAPRPTVTTMLTFQWLKNIITAHALYYVIHILHYRQTMLERDWEVGNPSISLLLAGSSVHSNNSLCCFSLDLWTLTRLISLHMYIHVLASIQQGMMACEQMKGCSGHLTEYLREQTPAQSCSSCDIGLVLKLSHDKFRFNLGRLYRKWHNSSVICITFNCVTLKT